MAQVCAFCGNPDLYGEGIFVDKATPTVPGYAGPVRRLPMIPICRSCFDTLGAGPHHTERVDWCVPCEQWIASGAPGWHAVGHQLRDLPV
jgi:hypothetical protein